MDANWVEKFLVQKFSQFLGSVDSVDENDGLVEGQ